MPADQIYTAAVVLGAMVGAAVGAWQKQRAKRRRRKRVRRPPGPGSLDRSDR